MGEKDLVFHDRESSSAPKKLTTGREYLTLRYGHFSNGIGIPKLLDNYVEYLIETKQIQKL
jgi:hypothetical protein